VSCTSLTFRRPIPDDHARVSAVMVDWWGGRDLRGLAPRIFFEHFRATSFVVEHEDQLVAFLVGFDCPDHPGEAYVHLCGVHPAWRRAGLGRDLYRRFCAGALARGRSVVRAVTAPVNTTSIAFHTGLGFTLLPGDEVLAGVPVTREPGPYGEYLVHFELGLAGEAGA
jgi:GNAT superfamily N-acetyltransferase